MAAAAEHDPAAARLKVTEIFFSIQGEAVFSGLESAIRLMRMRMDEGRSGA